MDETQKLQQMSQAAIKRARQATVLPKELDEILSLFNGRLRHLENASQPATSPVSFAPTTGLVEKPSLSPGASRDSSQAPSPVETWGSSRSIESIVTACERYLNEALPKPNYHFSPIRQSEFLSFLKSTLQSHLTCGETPADGDRGRASPNRYMSRTKH